MLEAVASKDISLTGIALTTKKQYASGDIFLLKLHLRDPMEKTPLSVHARVMRTYPGREAGTFHVGLRFMNLSRGMNDTISKYVYAQQQKQLKNRRRAD
jgi:c-di-GMP-binding flagellar brake protein YcgR